VPERGSLGIEYCRESDRSHGTAGRGPGVQKRYQSPGKTKQSGDVFPRLVPQGMVQKGKIETVNEAIGVNKVQRFFGHGISIAEKLQKENLSIMNKKT
jgi:hypothetical protein